jgi:hypothetical protein
MITIIIQQTKKWMFCNTVEGSLDRHQIEEKEGISICWATLFLSQRMEFLEREKSFFLFFL